VATLAAVMLLRTRHAVVCAVLGSLIVPTSARAEANTERPIAVALEYDVPDACPSVETFRQQIEARGSERALFLKSADGDATQGRLRVRVLVTAERYGRARAQLTIVSSRGDTSERAFDAATCEEVVDASALLVAIAMEAERGTSEPKAPPRAALPASSKPSPLSFLVYAGAGVGAGLGPSFGPALEGGVGLRSRHAWGSEARLEARHVRLGTTEVQGGTARFDLVAGAVEGCPVAFRAYGLRLSPCAAIAVGRLSAIASGFANARERAVLYFGAEIGGRLTVELGPAFLGMEAWGTLPLTRETFIFGTAGTAHRLASLGISSSASLGLHFR